MRAFVIALALCLSALALAGSVVNSRTGNPLSPVGTFTPGDCLKAADAQGSPQDNGAPCGSAPGALQAANNLSDVNSAITSNRNLGTAYNQDVAESANFTITTAQRGKVFQVTTGSSNVTATLPAAATAGDGFFVFVRKADSGSGLVLTSPSTQAIGKAGHMLELWSDGTTYYARFWGGADDTSGNYTLSSAGSMTFSPGASSTLGSSWTWNGQTLGTAYGGTGTGSTLTGVVRGGNPLSASEISGDCTTSGSNAITCTKTNGTSFTSAATTATASTSAGSSSSGLLPVLDARGLIDQSMLSGSIYPVQQYGAKCDGSTDDSTAVQNAINAAQGTGGVVLFPAGTCRINSQLVMPNDGTSPVPYQRPVMLKGAGSHMIGRGTAAPYGGTILDLRTNATDGKLVTYGLGKLEIRDLTFYDGGTNSNVYILTTNTTLHVYDTSFEGNPGKTGATCDQDAIVLGGTTSSFNNTSSAAYQGYSSVIAHNYFMRVRRAIYCRSDCNANMFVMNNIWAGSGTNLANGAAIEFNSNGGGVPTGNYVAGNLIENSNYTYGIKVVDGGNNTFVGNDEFDSTGSTVAAIRFESTTNGRNVVLGSLAGGSPAIYVSDAMSPSTNCYLSTDQGHPTTCGPMQLFDDGGVPSKFPRVVFNGGPARTIIQPDATQVGGAVMLQGLRSAAEGTAPNGVFFEVDYNGTMTLGDGTGGTSCAQFSNAGKTWQANCGNGGNMIINSGTGGSYLRLQNFGTKIESTGGTLQALLGGNTGWNNSAEELAFGSSSDAILTRVGADTIAMNRGTNPQSFYLSNTYTSTTNYERGGLTWNGNQLQLVTQKGTSGSLRDIVLAPGTGHFGIHGTAPTVGSGSSDCGTSPAIAGNDMVARITVGSSTNGGKCTVTFANTGTWANSPVCSCNDETTATACQAVPSTTASVALKGSFVAGDSIGMICQVYE